jgi:hypothetical protein
VFRPALWCAILIWSKGFYCVGQTVEFPYTTERKGCVYCLWFLSGCAWACVCACVCACVRACVSWVCNMSSVPSVKSSQCVRVCVCPLSHGILLYFGVPVGRCGPLYGVELIYHLLTYLGLVLGWRSSLPAPLDGE